MSFPSYHLQDFKILTFLTQILPVCDCNLLLFNILLCLWVMKITFISLCESVEHPVYPIFFRRHVCYKLNKPPFRIIILSQLLHYAICTELDCISETIK